MSDKPMKHIALPTWDETECAVDTDTATPLDFFIYHNEPGGPDDKKFRQRLKEALNFAAAREDYRYD